MLELELETDVFGHLTRFTRSTHCTGASWTIALSDEAFQSFRFGCKMEMS